MRSPGKLSEEPKALEPRFKAVSGLHVCVQEGQPLEFHICLYVFERLNLLSFKDNIRGADSDPGVTSFYGSFTGFLQQVCFSYNPEVPRDPSHLSLTLLLGRVATASLRPCR